MVNMETRRLGNSDLEITRIGFGAWAAGGSGWAFAWGAQDDRDSISAIHAALDVGINWIDTAAVYGLGHSEQVVAQALEGRAKKPYVFTKCARAWNEKREIVKRLKADSIRGECEASLRRLRVDVIDLYQMHWPEPDEDIEEGWTTMVRLKEEGKVRWIGVSNFNVPQMDRIAKIAPITSLQPPYSLVNPAAGAEILPYCGRNNIGVIVYSPMGSGLLTGKMTLERIASLPSDDWRTRNPRFQEPALSRHLAAADLLREIGKRHGASAGEVAIAWTLANPNVTAAIVGARNARQIEETADAGRVKLTAADLAEIERFCAERPV
jgi:aryl-alcohol dehydrogenase-like predicted oxidoreductase